MNEITTNSYVKPAIQTRTMALIAVFTALTCILAPMSLSIPISPVPISLTNLVIYFSIYILGWKRGTVSYILYLLIGLIGIPVFSGYTSGPAKLFGPTGGYLIGFILMALVCGIFVDYFKKNYYLQALGFVLGTAICYALGTLWLSYQANLAFKAALMAGVIPFIPGDLVKIILAIVLGNTVRQQLQKFQK
ncbi:MAG: biotin transporter BioY [Lachnospiraceae bacterium]|nr:biotin transporter BioY [Lachnospiraceae bacterium]